MATQASNKALGTPELLEMILLRCSTAEVTRARQVSSFFKKVIDKSKGLRQAMFLEPVPFLEREMFLELGVDFTSDDVQLDGSVQLDLDDSRSPPSEHRLSHFGMNKFHPIFRPQWAHVGHYMDCNRDLIIDGPIYLIQGLEFDWKALRAWPSGLWEKMHITQSPHETIEVYAIDTTGEEYCFQHDVKYLGDLRHDCSVYNVDNKGPPILEMRSRLELNPRDSTKLKKITAELKSEEDAQAQAWT